MKKFEKSLVFAIVGVLLLLSAVGIVVFQRVSIAKNQENASQLVEVLKTIIPSPKTAFPDGRANPEMAVFELDGSDFIGLIDFPSVGRELPVCSVWDSSNVSEFPHRFYGSCYDNTLIIGGSDNQGQLDFQKTISLGDSVFVTAINGDRFSYKVSSVEKTDDVSFQNLSSLGGNLVVFFKNTYSLDYTVIICE